MAVTRRRLLVLILVATSHAAIADPPRDLAPPHPITELDVYRDMAEFWRLAGLDESLLVRAGGGVTGADGMATLELGYRSQLRGLWELLPNTISSGIWRRDDGNKVVPLSIGWQLDLGIFSAPYAVVNALGTWTPANGALDAGFEVGFGYEWRTSVRWAIAGDVRVTALWSLDSGNAMDDRSPWGVRGAITLRRYFGATD